MHVCEQVHVFGFTGSGGWYYNKQENRKKSNKELHIARLGRPGTSQGDLEGSESSSSNVSDPDAEELDWAEDGIGGSGELSDGDGSEGVNVDDHRRRALLLLRKRGSSKVSGRGRSGSGSHLPTGHKLKVERSCMARLAARGIITHHALEQRSHLDAGVSSREGAAEGRLLQLRSLLGRLSSWLKRLYNASRGGSTR
jgi:hypothetical protein